MNARRLSACEERLLDIAQHDPERQVVACGLVETRAALRFVEWGLAHVVRWGGTDINGTTTSLKIQLTPRN